MRPHHAASTLTIALASLSLAACSRTSDQNRPAAPSDAAMSTVPEGYQVPTQLPANVRPLEYRISAQPDAANMRFSGRTVADIEVLEATDSITLNAADLEISKVTLSRRQGPGAPLALNPIDISMNSEKQTATFRFDRQIAPGRYQLDMDYAGKINAQAAGLFALDYPSPQGQKRALYTQFAASDARRFFPGWDEPQFRTPYKLTVTVPAEQMAVSNMPEAGVQTRPGGLKTVTFQTTPAMSSYLLFLGVGDFDRITATAGGTEIGIVTKKGDGEKGRFALDGSAELVPWFNDYFGTPYPLPKLDNVAGPGNSQFFAAMENWGAIFSFEYILLVDPAITTEANRQSIYSVAAHEIAHQWFGNLVTMAWWDDIWLNEGFASWMATKATSALRPEWQSELSRVNGREAAMGLDAVATTHPVVQRVTTVDQISQVFDSITYQKGEAVITMLEDYVGEDAWRRGVQDYMRTYRLKNTVTDNLWQKIEAASGKPVTAIARDFTVQPGIPLIQVEAAACEGSRTSLRLRQGEFTRDRPNKQPLAWQVPVIAAPIGGEKVRTLVEGGSAALTLLGCGPVVVNSGQSGYYRTLYTPALLDQLTASFARLAPIDQIGLLADNWSLGLAGHQSASEALDMVDAVPQDANPRVWTQVSGILASIYRMYDGDKQRQAMLSRYASAKLSPILKGIGWAPKAGEQPTIPVLRSQLIGTLGAVGDPEVVAEANRRFATNHPSVQAGPLRSTITSIVALNVTPEQWDRLRAQAKAEQNPLVKAQLYRLLGSARDPALARRALELALTAEPGATTSAGIISAVAVQHSDLAFDFAVRNRAAVEGLVDVSSRSSYLPQLAGGSANPAMVAKLQDYATRFMTPESRRPADQSIVAIQERVRVRQTRLPDITRWLETKRT